LGLLKKTDGSGESVSVKRPGASSSYKTYKDRKEEYWQGKRFAAAPGADDPDRPKRGKNTLPGYDEAGCTRCGKGIGPEPRAFKKKTDVVWQYWCKRCLGTLPIGWRYNDNSEYEIAEFFEPPDSVLRSHLPVPTDPPKPYSGEGCSKCGKAFISESYGYVWLPTNEWIRLCPSCNSRMIDHVGWGNQVESGRFGF